ncbi:MAG: hypothetical protein IT285_09620 [Bdellovibrionales bacterium]|nr:hypothetical protein [Bdellovibrionales bacterium]
MPVARVPALCVLIAALALGGGAAPLRADELGDGDTADRFKAYVDRMIPLSFDLARGNAEIRESALGLEILSLAQQAIFDASHAVGGLARAAGLLPGTASVACPVDLAGRPDPRETLRQVWAAEQLAHWRERLGTALRAFDAIVRENQALCSRELESDYLVSRIDFGLEELNVEALDGAYVEFSDPLSFLAYSLVTVVQLAFNLDEQSRIDEAKERYRRRSVQNRDYASFARAACRRVDNSLSPALSSLAELARKYSDRARLYGDAEIEAIRRRANACLDLLEAQAVTTAHGADEARKRVNAHRRVVGLNRALSRSLFLLPQAACRGYLETRQRIEGQLAAAELLSAEWRADWVPTSFSVQVAEGLALYKVRCAP